MDTALLLFILLAASAGVAAGWFLGTRQAALYRKERDDRIEDFRKAITDLADMQAQARRGAPGLRRRPHRMRAAVRRRRGAEREFQERLEEMKDARETFRLNSAR